MSPVRGAVWITVLLLGITVVVSGPAVPHVDFTREPAVSTIGSGTADFSVVSLRADAVRFETGRFGAGLSLRVPPAVIEVSTVTGAPTVVYEVVIPALGFVRTELHFLHEDAAGSRVRLRMDAVTFEPGDVTRESYRAVLRIGVRDGPETDVRYQRNVTVPVRR